MTISDIVNLQQALAEAEGRVERMVIALTREGQTKMAERAANDIEELFAVGGMKRDDRFKHIVAVIRRELAIAVDGEANWHD